MNNTSLMQPAIKSALLLFSIIASCFFICVSVVHDFSGGMDTTTQIAYQFALQQHLTFGENFISVFGPLGFLVTRIPVNQPFYAYVLFDIFIIGNLSFVVYTVLSRENSGRILRVILITIATVSGDITFLAIIISVFLYFEFLNTKGPILIINAILVSTLVFFIRVDLGLVSLSTLLLITIYSLITKLTDYKTSITVILACVIIIISLSYLLNTNLGAYLSSGILFFPGHETLAARTDHNETITPFMAVAAMAFMAAPFLLFFRRILSDKKTFIAHLTVIVLTIILFKESLMVFDEHRFFDSAILLAGLLAFFSRVESERVLYYTLIPIIVLTISFSIQLEEFSQRTVSLFQPGSIIKQYFENYELLSTTATDNRLIVQQIPDDVLKIVGNQTIDALPANDQLLISNKLNYRPRFAIPHPNSKVDFALPESTFILSNIHTVNSTNFLFEDVAAKLHLLENYQVIHPASNWSYEVLKRRSKEVQIVKNEIFTKEFQLEDSIILPATNELQLAYPEIKQSLAGSIFSFLLWKPHLTISLMLNDGTTKTFPLPEVSKAGLIINRFVPSGDNNECLMFLNFFGKLNTSVRAIKIASSHSWAFKSRFTLTLKKLKFSGEEPDMESTALTFKEVKKLGGPSTLEANIDILKMDGKRGRCIGWVFANDPNKKHFVSALLLESKNQSLVFPIKNKYPRPDIKAVFKNSPDSIGFDFTFFMPLHDSSSYRVGIALLDNYKIVQRKIMPDMYVGNSFATTPNKFTLTTNDKEEDLAFSVEHLKVGEKTISISGWAYIKDKTDNNYDSIKIILRSKDNQLYSIPATVVVRKDVSSHFKNSKLDSTGFNVVCSTKNLKTGDYAWGIYIKDKMTRGGKIKYINLIPIYPEFFNVSIFNKPLEIVEDGNGIRVEIEHLTDSAKSLRLTGWAVIPETDASKNEIFILLKSDDGLIYSAPVKKTLRPDITAFFKNGFPLDESGFDTAISKSKLPEGKYEIGICVSGSGKSVAHFTDQFIEME